MLLKESQMRLLIQSLLLEGTPKTDAELSNMTLFKIPRLRGGYYTLYKLLKDSTDVNVTGVLTDAVKQNSKMSSVSAFRKFYKDKFLKIGDQINLKDLADDSVTQPVIINKKKEDVFDERKVLGGGGSGGAVAAGGGGGGGGGVKHKKVALDRIKMRRKLEEQADLLPDKVKFDDFIKNPANLKLHIRDGNGVDTTYSHICGLLDSLFKRVEFLSESMLSTVADTLVSHDVDEKNTAQPMSGFKHYPDSKLCLFEFTETNKNKILDSLRARYNDIESEINALKFDINTRVGIEQELGRIYQNGKNDGHKELKEIQKYMHVHAYFIIESDNNNILNDELAYVKKYRNETAYNFGWDMGFAVSFIISIIDNLATLISPGQFRLPGVKKSAKGGTKVFLEGVGNDRLLRGYIRGVLRS
jgi:hypothetical protein